MTFYEIIVNNGTNTGTLIPDGGFNYTDKLNEINEGTLKFSGTGATRRGLLIIGAKVEIKKNGTRDFYGKIQTIDYMEAGTVVANLLGQEVVTARENGDYSNSPYTSTASASIAGDIIGESSTFTAGTINAGYTIDHRIATSQSLWNALSNLCKKTSQDIQIDYINTEIDVLDHRGNSTPVATLNQGIDIINMRLTQAYPKGNNIKVFGKGDGEFQITATDSDATSIAAYGTITRTVIDRSVVSDDEADRLAAAELALTKDPTKIYDFDMINPYRDFTAGDHLYLNATDMDLSNEEVRIVGIKKGEKNGKEYMTLQVTNAAYKSLIKTRNKILAGVMKNQTDAETYMQGAPNTVTWGSAINANSSTSLKVGFYLSPNIIQDEAGNLQVNLLTVDYDLDPYSKQVGDATFTGTDPQVQNSSGDEGAAVAGTSDNTEPTVTGTSDNSSVDTDFDYEEATEINGGDDYFTDTLSLVSGDTDFTIFTVWLKILNKISDSLSGYDIEVENTSTSSTYVNITSVCTVTDIYIASFVVSGDIEGDTIKVSVDDNSGSGYSYTYGYSAAQMAEHNHGDGSYSAANHSHTDGSFAAADHDHPDGSYDINAADLDDFTIGDSVSDAGSVNATEVDIYLDYWNTGTSSWDNKHSVLNTGKTLDTDVDISNSGTYPDATGFWRIRIVPNNASPDLVKGIVKMKYNQEA